MQEKYFVFCITEDGDLEPVVWFKTLKEAKAEANEWKRKYPEDMPIYVGELLVELKEE